MNTDTIFRRGNDAIIKADAMNRKDDELHYTELHYANWTDSDGNFYEEDFYC